MAFERDISAVPTVQQDDGDLRITRWDFAPGAATDSTGTNGRTWWSCSPTPSFASTTAPALQRGGNTFVRRPGLITGPPVSSTTS